ncbi:MAG TPA: NADH-ubiquinone oxidoreductase-F iron-sulfur binding region domain-containing protein, partial [Mycobacteriales bacterium]|nr:NADH-ubiquinone oxidoreductase-F iron-sulfur binding region domain-containing protein [Mycobacteriales bacterium]
LQGARADGLPMSRAEHLAVHGPLPAAARHDAKHLQAALAGAGLRGRGGAGFPVARKLAVALDAGGRGPLVVNATEGEPASLKDGTLVGLVPHLVLDGAQLAARSVRAREVVVAVHEGGPLPAVLERALRERPDDAVPTRLLQVPARYLSGEASALARAAAGGPSRPVLHDVPLAVRGPAGRPTVVLNAESVADLALYLLHGPARYAGHGTPEEPGTLLVTVRSSGTRPAVLEVPLGTPVRDVLSAVAVPPADVQAVLLGGYFGRWLRAPAALDVPLSHAGARAAGGVLGAGVVMALTGHECGLRATAHAVRYLAGESAGQCGPCTNGLPAIATDLERLVGGFADPGVLERLRRRCGLVEGRGLCSLPDGVSSLVASALTAFADDLEAHLGQGCGRPAGAALAVPALVA